MERYSLPTATRQNTNESSNLNKVKTMGQKITSTFKRGQSTPVMAEDCNWGRARETSNEDRRELLRRRIVVMGDPTYVGVPF